MRTAVIFVLTLTCGIAAVAQTTETGAIIGRVTAGTAAIAGARVEARSPALPGLRAGVTDESGSVRFALLPPGQYVVTVARSGFKTRVQENIVVGLTKTATVDITLEPGLSEEVTVTADPPAIDVYSTISGLEITPEAMSALPLQRKYTAAAVVAPGTQSDFFGPGIYGSTSPENQYVVDGLNVTDVIAGHDSKNVSVDFVEQIHVMTAGLPAEYGRITGGIVNAVTKSGSSEFHASAFAYRAVGRMIAQPKYLPDLVTFGATQWGRTDENSDHGFSAGGPLIRDRLWAFAAYDRVVRRGGQVLLSDLNVSGFSLPAGGKVPFFEENDLQSFKVTLALTSSHIVTGSLIGDPWTRSGALAFIQGPPSTWEGTSARGGMNPVIRYAGSFGSRWTVNAMTGKHEAMVDFKGPGTSTPLFVDRTVAPANRSGGFGQYSDNSNQRRVSRVDVGALLFSSHVLKVGVDEERPQNNIRTFFSGGDRVIKMCSVALRNGSCPSTGITFYEHSGWLNDLSSTFDRNDPASFSANIVNPMTSSYKTLNRSAYVQDSFALGRAIVNAGVRYERQVLNDRKGIAQITVNNLAPRLGVVWDPRGDGRSKVYGHYGRYFESIPMYLDIYLGSAAFVRVNNLSPTPGNFTPDSGAPAFGTSGRRYLLTGGATPVPIEPRIKGQYLDEFVVGYERDLGRGVTVAAKAIHRDVPRVIEDVIVDARAGRSVIGNPGEGAASSISFLSGEIVPAPRPTRRYNALELHAVRRFTQGTQLYASYLWSRLYGNYEGLFQSSAGQLSPNVNVAFDYGEYLINAYGPLPNDRTHQVKIHGSYAVKRGVARGATVGLAPYWYSGSPVSAMSSGQFVAPRGSLGRGPGAYEVDVHLGYPVSVRHARFELLLDVFNALNRQGATEVDQAYRTFVDGPCGGIPQEVCNLFGGLKNKPGTTQPIAELPDPRATAPNRNFLKGGVAFTPPRQIRVGARLRF